MKIEVREEQDPLIARVILADEWEGKPMEAKQLLENIYDKWPEGKRVKFLITCGGFVVFEWPEDISRDEVGNNKNPNDKVINKLMVKAEECINSVLTEDLCKKLNEVTDYITLGIDSSKEKISTTQNYIKELHIELVFLKDLKRDKLYWTGKSYPTTKQQDGLIRIAKLETHFLNLDIGKVMVLGCHDLNIFNPRSKNAKGWRKKVNNDFKKLAQKEKPVYVLHHPHTTVKRRTWLNAWNGLTNTLQHVKYGAAGRYYELARPSSEWDDLNTVLQHTKNCNSIDFIILKNY